MLCESSDTTVTSKRHLINCINILDSGSATTLAGLQDAEEWVRLGFARSYTDPLPSAIRHIRGIGARNKVEYWLEFTLDIGGAYVTFHDIPVLRGHRGLLLGNEFLGAGRASLKYSTDTEGVLRLHEDDGTAISLPVAFRTDLSNDGLAFVASQSRRPRKRTKKTRSTTQTASDVSASESEDECMHAADFGEITEAERAERLQQQLEAAEVEKALEGVAPIAWAPETVNVPAWSEVLFKVRVPETLAKAKDVLLTPLEDERQKDLGVLIAPTLQRVDDKGYVTCRAINLQKKKVRIPLLTPVARFQIDPRVYKVEHEYTVDEIVERIHVDEGLNDAELQAVKTMLSTRRALFRSKLGYAHGYKMKLRVPAVESGEKKPPNAQLRVRSAIEEEALIKEVNKQLSAGLIEPARSPYNALPMLVKKPTKPGEPQQFRVVLDYRGVNALLEKDVYPLPNLETNLAALGKANWFSTLDLLQGFHQVELEDDGSKEVTGFSTPIGQFQYVRMPMGLASSPSTFMRLVDATLRGLPIGTALAYVDDVVIPTCGTFEDHLRDVGKVFDRLIEAGFAVRCDKCHIGLKEVPYLGFMVGAYGTRPQAAKTKAIFDLAVQDMYANPAAAARYAGMLGFYHKFIPDLHTLLAPFHDLKAKAAPVDDILGGNGKVPSLRFLASFAATRQRLAEVTALVRPDPAKPFYIHVDAASSCGIGAALLQLQDEDDPESFAPIAFASRRLRDEERGYSVRDQECLALYEALKGWRHYILGRHTILLSDHASLQWLLSSPHADGSNVSGWALYAQQFDLEIKWIPGKINIVSDFFSRSATNTEMGKEVGATGENQHMLFERLAASEEPDGDASESFAGMPSTPIFFNRIVRLIQSAVRRHLATRIITTTTTATRPLSVTVRRAERVAVVFVQRTASQDRILVDYCDDGLGQGRIATFPSALVDKCHNLTYRQQARGLIRDLYGNDQLCSMLTYASAFRCRTGRAHTHFFVSTLPEGVQYSGCFEPINSRTLSLFTDVDDCAFLRLLARSLDKPLGPAANHWVGSFSRVRLQLDSSSDVDAVNACVAAWTTTSEDATVPPSILEKPYGPALCETTEHGDIAIERICARLYTHIGLSLSVDLEGKLGGRRGHIDLMQLAVASVENDEEPLVFVFNTHANRDFLNRGQLRAVLEDPEVPKVMHCCYGDASALYLEYGIQVKGGFDTGVADCLLRGVGFNRQRKLDTVIADYLPSRVFTYKGGFVHTPGMFQHKVGQLPYRLFVYAYEDVLHCCELYVVMKEALMEAGLLELTTALTAMRIPPRSLPRSTVECKQPDKIVVAFRDEFSMVCLQDQSGLCSLPQSPFDPTQPDHRAQAFATWSRVMGAPPKSLQGAFSNRMRKAVRLADTMLFEVVVEDCKKYLPALRTTKELLGGGGLLTLLPCYRPAGPLAGMIDGQAVPLQYLHWSSRGQPSPGLVNSVEANVVVGKVNSPLRAAVVVHDKELVYTLTTSSNSLAFPSAPIEVDADPREAAFKAFDTFAGPALRKHDSNVVGNSVMPASSARIRAGFDNMTELTTEGNTIFYSCFIPSLGDLTSAFYAARNTHTGHRLTATLAKRHPGFSLCNHERAWAHLDTFDAVAFRLLYPEPSTTAAAVGGTVSQHSGTLQLESDAGAGGAVSQHSGPHNAVNEDHQQDIAWHEQDMVQSTSQPDNILAGDVEDERLFDAAVCVHYAELLGGALSGADSAAGVVGTGTLGDSSVTMPSVAELLEAQAQHPATAPWLEYLQTGELSTAWREARTEEAREELKQITDHFCLDGDGLLCRRSREQGPRKQTVWTELIIVPPELQQRVIHQYHDKQCHFGVDKTLKLLQQRFYWGGADVMRKSVSNYIRSCHPCQLSKPPNHQAGEQQISFCGHHPGDVLCGDVFYVGFEEDGYDHTLDFLDLFDRGVRSDAMKGMPDSEEIIDTMIQGVIRQGGVPSEVRSDAGSNFISKAVRMLYQRMGISITVGTAYRHQLVALAERWHRTLLQLIRVHRAAITKAKWGSKWYRCLPLMELAYNITVNNSTGFSPFFIRHLRHARSPVDLQRTRLPELPKELADWVQERLDDLNVVYDAASESLRVNALAAKRRYDLHRDVSLWFKPGDRVLLIKGTAFDKSAVHPKATLPLDGPFTVTKALPHDRYLLADLKTRRIRNSIHVSRLVPYFGRVDTNDSIWKLTTHDSGGSWPVQGLVGRRVTTLEKPWQELGLDVGDRVLEYRVRWTGFDRNSDKWRPLQTLGEVAELVNEYDSQDPRPAEFTESLERIDRPAGEPPTVSTEALNRRHFRSHPHPGEQRPPVDSDEKGVAFEPKESEKSEVQQQDLQKQLAESLQRFPVNARVRVHYPTDGTSWTGTIVKSWLPRWRTADKQAAHHITVRYDDPAFKGELFTHDVQQSIIEIEREGDRQTVTDEKRTQRTIDDTAGFDKSATNEEKLRKRLQRLRRELG